MNIQKEIQVVHNFIDTDKLEEPSDTDKLKRRLNIQSDEKVMIHISNFRKVKRVQDVIHVFHRVQQSIKTKLLLVGDGPEYGDAYQLVQNLGLQDKVIFMGRQDNIHDLFAMSDLNLLVSEKESFGLVLLEAMISGVPSIGSNTGGIPEVIDDGETGYICEVGDVETMSKRAIHLLSEESEWKRQSLLSKARVKELFDAEQIIKRYENIYYEV